MPFWRLPGPSGPLTDQFSNELTCIAVGVVAWLPVPQAQSQEFCVQVSLKPS